MTSYNMLLSLTRYTPLSSVQKPVSSLYTIWLRMGFRVHLIVIIPNILVIIGEYNAIYIIYIIASTNRGFEHCSNTWICGTKENTELL